MTRESVLARAMVELADNMVDDFDIVELLSTLTTRCVEVLDVAAAGIMLVDADGDLRLMSSSDVAMRTVELFEIQAHEGPCLDCLQTGAAVVNQDLTTSDRWPRFAAVAVNVGYRSVDAVPLRLRGQIIGALNLFRKQTGSLSDDDVAVTQALADVATIAILQHRTATEAQVLNTQLQTALSSRIVIEQAKGIIAERQQLSVDAAFDRLRRYARDHNQRLADVANAIVVSSIDPQELDVSNGRSPQRH